MRPRVNASISAPLLAARRVAAGAGRRRTDGHHRRLRTQLFSSRQRSAALATYRPSVVTRVYADDGETVIGEFALEKRIPLKYEEIPPVMKNAILAVEDARFYDHVGIDPIRIIGAAWKNLTSDKVEGGSTLTQQLAKNLFLSKEQTLKRKMNEWALALQIERYYTKNQIMELYANHIFLGANAYGVEAGAETYFGKQAKDLTIGEAALLAGVPKAPSEYSPTSNPAQGERASRSRSRLDGEEWFCHSSGSRCRQSETNSTR